MGEISVAIGMLKLKYDYKEDRFSNNDYRSYIFRLAEFYSSHPDLTLSILHKCITRLMVIDMVHLMKDIDSLLITKVEELISSCDRVFKMDFSKM